MIRLHHLSKRYGERIILDDVSLNFPDKGMVSLLGPSGIGKSSVFNIIAGFDTDYKGEVTIGTMNLSHASSDDLAKFRHQNIGFAFQNHHLLSSYTVLENVLIATDSSDKYQKRALYLLERFNVLDKKDELVDNLSGGQKQRVAIARALIHEPKIILADEPTGALDYKSACDVMALLQSIAEDHLVVMITHDKEMVRYADYELHFDNHKLIGLEMVSNIEGTDIKSDHLPTRPLWIGYRNFKRKLSRLGLIAISVALGVLAVVVSLSSGARLEQDIMQFKEKNTAFNVGYVPKQGKDELLFLESLDEVDLAFSQFVLQDLVFQFEGKDFTLVENYPMPISQENLSYGRMPFREANEIAVSATLSKKLVEDIGDLVDKTIMFQGQDLRISGVYNASYDAVIFSSDIEQGLYHDIDGDPYSTYYTVNDFKDVATVSQKLNERKIAHFSAADQVNALLSAFDQIQLIFTVLSIIFLTVALLIGFALLIQYQTSKVREIGLYKALGFNRRNVHAMVFTESLLLSLLSVMFLAFGIIVAQFLVSWVIPKSVIAIALLGTFILISVSSVLLAGRAINMDPADALRA